jgi:pilus assembly protein CpaF
MDARGEALDELAGTLRARLLDEAGDGAAATELPARIRALVDREAGVLAAADREELARILAERAFGLGPLEALLRDPAVDEVMVSGTRPAWVERHGRLERTSVAFESDADLRHAIERILAPLGRRVDEAEPLCDARLPDGSRVNVVIPPLAVDGPALTIRRFRARGLGPDELVALGTWPADLREVLRAAVLARLNVLVSGGTGSGKTTTLNALSAFVPEDERIVTIEDTAELRLQQPHVVRLEARPANVEGRGEVGIRRLLRNALRMRPDRIVVGEVRGPEALEMLAAMTTGHDGSLSTVHASSPAEALRRVETLALMADVALPHVAVREQAADALDLIVHQARLPGGERRVVSVAEVVRVAGGPAVREVFTLRDGRPLWRAPLAEALAERLAGVLPLPDDDTVAA